LLLERNNDLTIAPLPDRPQHGGNLVWAASLAHCSPSAILDFSASINPLGPPESAIAAIQAHLGDLKAYPDPQYSALRSALGAFHQMPPEYILPGNGAAELLTWACRDLAALDGTYLFTPAFSDYQRALKAFNAHVLARPLAPQDDRHWNFEQALPLEAGQQRLSGQALGLLLNNPHNPTGSLLTKHRLQPHLYDYALVVVDEAFMDFLPRRALRPPPLPAKKQMQHALCEPRNLWRNTRRIQREIAGSRIAIQQARENSSGLAATSRCPCAANTRLSSQAGRAQTKPNQERCSAMASGRSDRPPSAHSLKPASPPRKVPR
jgi:hypothetical protein